MPPFPLEKRSSSSLFFILTFLPPKKKPLSILPLWAVWNSPVMTRFSSNGLSGRCSHFRALTKRAFIQHEKNILAQKWSGARLGDGDGNGHLDAQSTTLHLKFCSLSPKLSLSAHMCSSVYQERKGREQSAEMRIEIQRGLEGWFFEADNP